MYNTLIKFYHWGARLYYLVFLTLLQSLAKLNLFELSQYFSQTGPPGLYELDVPPHAPAPPSSAMGFYTTTQTTPSPPLEQNRY